jgi:hypothetical protein
MKRTWLLGFLLPTVAHAFPLVVVADVSRDDAPVDDAVDYEVRLAGGATTTCSGRDIPLRGTLVIECDAQDNNGAPIDATLLINGVEAWSSLVGVPARVAAAGRAAGADRADAAASIPGVDLIPRANVVAGNTAFSFTAVTGVPPGIADGVDQGNLMSVSAPLALNTNTGVLTLSALAATNIASIGADDWADGAVGAGNIVSGVLSSASVGTGVVATADIAANTVSGNDVTAASLTTWRRVDVGCTTASRPGLTTAANCSQIRGTCAVGQLRACSTGTCTVDGVVSSCTNPFVGRAFAP